jgi:DNA-binding response OmpR family regulator
LLISSGHSWAQALLADAIGRSNQLTVAVDWVQAARILRRNEYDAVLWDVNKPDDENLVWLRQVRRNASLPVVLLLSPDAREEALRGEQLGAVAWFHIPCDPRVLEAQMDALMRRMVAVA